MKVYLLGFLVLLSTAIHAAPSNKTVANSNEPTYCEETILFHGMMSRAQFECGYSQYNDQLINEASQCIHRELGEDYGDKLLKYGMAEYDLLVKKKGKQNTCRTLLKEYPNVVRK